MDVYFANKQCNKFCKINLPTTVAATQKQNNRPHSAMKAAEIDLKDRIKINFKAVVVPRVKANPSLFMASLDTLLMNNRPLNLDYLDDMLKKNEKKRSDYGALNEIANIPQGSVLHNNSQKRAPVVFPPVPNFSPLDNTSPNSPPMRSNVPFDIALHANWSSQEAEHKNSLPAYHRPNSLPSATGYNVVDELINLTGMDRGKATRYVQRHGSIERAFQVHEHQKASILEFMRRERITQNEAEFLLESTNYNMTDAANLFKQMRR